MKKSITIKIPEPCHEDWNKMTPTEKGKFCNNCSKEVYDFTNMSDEALVKHLAENKNLCGRFKKTQLDREVKLARKSRNSFAPYAASVLLPMAILSTSQLQGQESITAEKTHIPTDVKSYAKQGEVKVHNHKDTGTLIIKGTITDDNGYPLSGANIVVKGTSQGTQSDFDGLYSMEVKPSQTLVFSYVGFITREIIVSTIDNTIHIVLKEGAAPLGELVIVGGLVAISETDKRKPAKSHVYLKQSETAKQNEKEFKRLQKARKKEKRRQNRSQ